MTDSTISAATHITDLAAAEAEASPAASHPAGDGADVDTSGAPAPPSQPPPPPPPQTPHNGCNPFGVTEIVTASMPYVVKKPSATSKLILQNMEEVLNSIKKKHRHKHRRKREHNKKTAQMERDAEEDADDRRRARINKDDAEPPTAGAAATSTKKHEKRPRKHHKKPLQEKAQPQENGAGVEKVGKATKAASKPHNSPLKGMPVSANNSILKHFPRTPKKGEEQKEDEQDIVLTIDESIDGSDAVALVAAVKQREAAAVAVRSRPPNAFEVMMNARNKSIGSNTSGKEVSPNSQADAVDEASQTKVRRKLMLQDWADKKGGRKRKQDEEERAEYVDKQLVNRAKRFKAMLVNGSSPQAGDEPKTPSEPSTATPEEPKRVARGRKSLKTPVVADGSAVQSAKAKGARNRGRSKRLPSVSSDALDVPASSPAIDVEDAEFLAKLSSPTKKRDSLLGYFPKKDSPVEEMPVNAESTTPAPTTTDRKTNKRSINKAAETPTDTPKVRGRRSKRSLLQAAAIATKDEEEKDGGTPIVGTPLATPTITDDAEPLETLSGNQTGTPSGRRPRRSCAGKSRYDFDLQESPTKVEKANAKRERTTESARKGAAKEETTSSMKAAEEDVIELDDSNSMMSPVKNTPQKLAPLFVRSMPKPNIAPELLRARQDFLRSGVPEKLRLEQTRLKQLEQTYEEACELFPSVCHVQQFSPEELEALTTDFITKLPFALQPLEEMDNIELELFNSMCQSGGGRKGKAAAKVHPTIGSLANCTLRDFRLTKTAKEPRPPFALPLLDNKRLIIKSWKSQFERFPTYKCYNQMREKYRYFNAIDSAQDTEQVTESFVVTRQARRALDLKQEPGSGLAAAVAGEEEAQPPATAPNGELLFSEKYKPMLFDQVLVNTTPVMQLRDFLSNWSGGGSARNSQALDDAMDDSNSSLPGPPGGNSVVLLGPVSSGKTNAVYALANEMNFNVLEINAGMKRTGKKLMQELQEATQSHQIRKDSMPRTGAGQTKSQQNLLKMTLNGQKTKVVPNNKAGAQQAADDSSSSCTTLELSQCDRKCLILIEDADIVFEQMDAGFIDAIHTLASSSKRPVIVVASDPNCGHLQRLMQQRTITFSAPHSTSITRFLSVLALMENCPTRFDDIVALYLYNNRDLRRTLLELQFFIQSGGDQAIALDQASSGLGKRAVVDAAVPLSDGCATRSGEFCVSPSKRRISVDPHGATTHERDEALEQRDRVSSSGGGGGGGDNNAKTLYMHRALFTFYTSAQNEQRRVPFPVDFQLLSTNLPELLHVSRSLQAKVGDSNGPSPVVAAPMSEAATPPSGGRPAAGGNKRRTRSPKKAWLNNAAVAITQQPPPLAALCGFYENVSVAALLGHNRSSAGRHEDGHDRLAPLLHEEIAHKLVESSLALDLAVEECPYNLYDTPADTNQSLCKYLTAVSLRSRRSCALDYEPTLRAICRSERQRAGKERRTSRFYHHLRSTAVNVGTFSTGPFNAACTVFQSSPPSSDQQSNAAEPHTSPTKSAAVEKKSKAAATAEARERQEKKEEEQRAAAS